MYPAKSTILFFLLLPVILLSGCANKHWDTTLEEEETAAIAGIIEEMQEADNSCPQNLDADVKGFLKTPTENIGVQGYLQLLSPSYLKFVLSNPLGQPMFILASNGDMFQSLDMTIRRHIRGSIRSLGIRNNIPLIIMYGDWYAFFTGRLPERPIKVRHIYRNGKEENVWIELSKSISLSNTPEYTYVSVDPLKRRVLGYLFLDDKGKTIAEISYSNPLSPQDSCEVRKQIFITELPWDSTISLELDAIQTDMQLQKEDFILPVPKDYSKQLHP